MDVRLPDGTVIKNVPDGTTKADLVTKLQRNGMAVPADWLAQTGPSTDGVAQGGADLSKAEIPGIGKTLLIGAGRTFDRVGKGMQQLYYGATQDDAAAAKLKAQSADDDAAYQPLKEARPFATSIGESIPSMVIPAGGGATLGANALRMAAAGAIPGAMEYGTAGERGGRALLGAVSGAAIPLLAAGAKTAKSFAEPLYQGGREAIAGRLLNRVAGDSAPAVVSRLNSAAPLVAGSMPTAAQVAESGGIAALERAASQANPEAYTVRAMEQANARLNALRGIAGNDAARAAQQDLVDKTAKDLYGTAFKESIDVSPELVKLAARPSMRAAEKRAISLSDELSMPFRTTLDNLRPQYINLGPRQLEARVVGRGPSELIPTQRPEVWIDAARVEADPAFRGLGVTRRVSDTLYAGRASQNMVEVPGKQFEAVLPAGRTAAEFMEIPPVSSVPVRDMHTLKMGMDALLSDRTLGIAGREAGAIKATREKLLNLLPESYQTARAAHIELNKPIHQMDIASELMNRVSPALSDFGALAQESGAKYAQALRGGDELAKTVTGLKNSTLEGVMRPDQMAALNAIGGDLARKANAQNLGRGVGSDTFQKIAMSNIAEQSGMPRMMGGLLSLPGVNRATRWIYQDADKQMQGLLSDALLNPGQTAKLMTEAERKLLANNPKSRKVLEQAILRAGLLGAPTAYSVTD